jgi:hypothetical protein
VRILQQTSARAVIDDLTAIRDPRAGSMPWTIDYIARADAQFDGVWADVEIDAAEARAIVLPPHAGEPCHGDRLALVPSGGATLDDTGRAFSAMAADYARENPSCWSRIHGASREPFSTIILTTAPLDVEEYASVARAAGTLYRLDGFHRLIGWTWAKRLDGDATLRAVVAGLATTRREADRKSEIPRADPTDG